MKILCETNGSFQLLDFSTGDLLPAERPAVMTQSAFVQSHVASGRVTVHGTLTEAATDEEFRNYLTDSEDPELAIAAFLASFGPGAGTSKKRRRRTQSDEAE